MLVELRCVGTDACSFSVSTKGNTDFCISPVITYNVEISSFRCCCIKTKPVDVELTLLWRRCNVANLDIITTLFWHRDAGGIQVLRYTCVFICHFYNGKQIFYFLFASLDDEAFQKGSTLKEKNPWWVMVLFFKNWLTLKRVVKTKLEVASL